MTSAEILHHIIDARYGGSVFIGPIEFYLSKHVVMLLLSAGVLSAVLLVNALRLRGSGDLIPRGRLANAIEEIVVVIRDGLVVPQLGEEEGRRYLPVFLTLFLFILTSNLLGMIPAIPQVGFEGGTATGNISINLGLASFVLLFGIFASVRKNGLLGYLGAYMPLGHEVHWAIRLIMGPPIFLLEIAGSLIKHAVLAIRLFANMIAGHMVILAILGMIFLFREMLPPTAAYIVATGPVILVLGIYLLEVLVAFIQAGVFLFLSTIFIGMVVNPHH